MKHLKYIISVAAIGIILLGCTTAKVSENPPGSGNYKTNYVTDPRVTSTIDTIAAVNDATKAANPFSGVVSIGLATAAALASWIAKRKNDSLTNVSGQLQAVVQGIEMAPSNQEVKDAIQSHATRMGVEGELSKTVLKVNSGG
jgi:hypothetical protein